jgi:hypothetical protein
MARKELTWKRPDTNTNGLRSALNKFSQVDKQVLVDEPIDTAQQAEQLTDNVSEQLIGQLFADVPERLKEQDTVQVSNPVTVMVTTLENAQSATDVIEHLAAQSTDIVIKHQTELVSVPIAVEAPDQLANQDAGQVTAQPILPVKLPDRWQEIANTHTDSEQRIYAAMYVETRKNGARDWYFTTQQIGSLTGLKQRQNIMDTVKRLAAKKSIDVLTSRKGEQFGVEYRIYDPTDIIGRRRKARLKIHPQTKRII